MGKKTELEKEILAWRRLRNPRLSAESDEYTQGDTRTLKEVSADIRQAGQEDEASKPVSPEEEEADEPPAPPEPKQKTPEEMAQNPEVILNPPDEKPNADIVKEMGGQSGGINR